MPAIDRARRVVTVVLVALALLVAPQVAFAGFSTPRTSPLQVGTTSLTAPSSPVETHVCPVRGNSEDFTVTLASFTGPSPAQLSYTYTYRLLRDGVEVATSTSTLRTTVLTYSLRSSNKFGAYSLSIEGRSGNWVSPALVVALPCLL